MGKKPDKKKTKNLPAKETPTGIKWLRGIGGAAILFSMLGLIQLFFWPSVILFYAGLGVALIDLFYEKFTRMWVKFALALVLIGAAALFTWKVVMRKDPIVAYYVMTNGVLRFHVTNTSDADYRDLDFKIKPDYPDNFIVDGKEASNLGGLKVLDPHYSSTDEKDERYKATADPAHPGIPTIWEANFLRFQCDKLSRQTGVEFTMGLERTLSDGRTIEQVTKVKKVILQGTYRGQFREYTVSQEAIDFRISPQATPFN